MLFFKLIVVYLLIYCVNVDLFNLIYNVEKLKHNERSLFRKTYFSK
jgi:hypothetical protein